MSFQKWYGTIAFMSSTKKGTSAKELQKQIDHKRYTSVWLLMHKVRKAMGNRDDTYNLTGMLEMDEGHFEVATKQGIKLKGGKGSQKQQNMAVLAESIPLEDLDTSKKSSHCKCFKMKALDNHKSESINSLFENNIKECSIIFTDKSTSYIDIANYVEVHVTERSNNETTTSTLKWVHIAISNAKRTLLGIYHKISEANLQSYLNEFCYKLNRRYFGNKLFDRLTLAVAKIYG
jgi:transposase-like protein